ncbi:GspH/FimT family pseudopilin [Aquabacterium sp.]|uniref:GspH/FimT family pseudopilin n=1 Tax=Aquabacterium sp. TaxID=1872578 RepID=UPI003D6C84CF
MKFQRGISMIEVVVTIAIMGILMAAAMPSVGDWLRNAKVRNTAESIQNGLQRARMEAVRLNKPMSFYLVSDLTSGCVLSASSGTWVVSAVSPVGHCDALPSATVSPMIVAKATVADGGGAGTVAATTGTTNATTVTFNGLGQITTASAGTAIRIVNVSNADSPYKRRVEISLGGMGRLCDPDLAINTGDSRACNNALVN